MAGARHSKGLTRMDSLLIKKLSAGVCRCMEVYLSAFSPANNHSPRRSFWAKAGQPSTIHQMHCAWKTGYTVTSLSINNLAGYKPVTPQLHGYILIHQQLSPHLPSTISHQPSICAKSILGRESALRCPRCRAKRQATESPPWNPPHINK